MQRQNAGNTREIGKRVKAMEDQLRSSKCKLFELPLVYIYKLFVFFHCGTLPMENQFQSICSFVTPIYIYL